MHRVRDGEHSTWRYVIMGTYNSDMHHDMGIFCSTNMSIGSAEKLVSMCREGKSDVSTHVDWVCREACVDVP